MGPLRRGVNVGGEMIERLAFAPDTAAESSIHEHLGVWPPDALIVMQTHFFYNLMDSRPDRDARMLATIERVAPAYGDDWFILGELGFAHEENGHYSQARDLAERSLAANP